MKLYRNMKFLLLIFMLVLFLSIILLMDESGDAITGRNTYNVYTRAEVVPTISKNCSVELYPGWNLVSFYCLGMFNPRSLVLSTIEDEYRFIFEYVAEDSSDPWKSYNPNLPNWTVQQLNYMDRISGYWIFMNSEANFSYSGVYSNSVIPLYAGWNLVGYTNTESQNITLMLNGVPFTVVKTYHKTLSNMSVYDNQTNTTYNILYYSGPDIWLIHVNGAPSNNLTQFNTYKGYWINVSSNSQWNITR
jgi:hypothetical protein